MCLRVHEYWKLLKPRVLLAMVALYAASYLASYAHQGGGPLDVFRFASGLAAVFAAVGGSNALNCYLDRDIDAVMVRTMARPLPRGSVGLRGALALGLLLLDLDKITTRFRMLVKCCKPTSIIFLDQVSSVTCTTGS